MIQQAPTTQPSSLAQIESGVAAGVNIGASIPSPIQPYLIAAGTILGLLGIGTAGATVAHANATNAATVATQSNNHAAAVTSLTNALTAAHSIILSSNAPAGSSVQQAAISAGIQAGVAAANPTK